MSHLILIVLLWTSGMGTWNIGHLILIRMHESAAANAYHQWCALSTRECSTKRALATYSPYILPEYMFLDHPHDVIRSVARSRLCAHTLRVETVIWTHNSFPTCDLCNAFDVQLVHLEDDQHVLSISPIHTLSLSVGLMRLCSLAPQVSTMCLIRRQ